MQGPKIRIGSFTNDTPVMLPAGATFTLSSEIDKNLGDQDAVYLDQALIEDIAVNDTLLLDDGKLSLTVTDQSGNSSSCEATTVGLPPKSR